MNPWDRVRTPDAQNEFIKGLALGHAEAQLKEAAFHIERLEATLVEAIELLIRWNGHDVPLDALIHDTATFLEEREDDG